MTAIRVAKRDRFTTVAQSTINDDRLSFRARGLLVWLLDKPDDWRVDSNAIARAGKEGRDAIRSALTELEEAGYVRRRTHRGMGGRFLHECVVYETPAQTKDGFSGPGSPTSVSQAAKPKTLTKYEDQPMPLSVVHSQPVPLPGMEMETLTEEALTRRLNSVVKPRKPVPRQVVEAENRECVQLALRFLSALRVDEAIGTLAVSGESTQRGARLLSMLASWHPEYASVLHLPGHEAPVVAAPTRADPLESSARAAAATRDRNARPPCVTCDSSGWDWRGADPVPCQDCRRLPVAS